jgi:hypothetical protein
MVLALFRVTFLCVTDRLSYTRDGVEPAGRDCSEIYISDFTFKIQTCFGNGGKSLLKIGN